MPPAPDAPAKLIELRQAEHVGTVDDHGVGRGDIDARFNDIRGKQDIRLAIGKAGHHVIQFIRRHLAMRRQDPRLRHQHRQPVIDPLQIGNPRADTENLSAAEHFALDGLAQHHTIPGADEGPHRQPVHRRRGNQRHLAHA